MSWGGSVSEYVVNTRTRTRDSLPEEVSWISLGKMIAHKGSGYRYLNLACLRRVCQSAYALRVLERLDAS